MNPLDDWLIKQNRKRILRTEPEMRGGGGQGEVVPVSSKVLYQTLILQG